MPDDRKDPVKGEHTATALRKLAEKADGMRGRVFELIIRDDDGMLDIRLENATDPAGKKVATVKTDARFPDLRKPDWSLSARVGSGSAGAGQEGGEIQFGDIRKRADAMFWDESSLDKFLRRYYDVVDPAQTAQAFDWWQDKDVIAILHPPKSETFRLKLKEELQPLVRTPQGVQIMSAAEFEDYRRRR